MKLVGATDWFIRWPFVLEGVLVGALGGMLAILLLGVVKIALVDPLADAVRADRRAGHDQLPAADRAPARRRRSASRRSAPACRCAASCASERLRKRHISAAVPCSPCRSRSAPLAAAPGRARSARSSCSSLLAVGHLARRPPRRRCRARPRHARRRQRRAALRRGDRHHRRRLLPQGRPQAAARQVARARRSQLAQRPLLQLLRPEGTTRRSSEATEGRFEGVGMNVEQVTRGLRMLTVFKGSPAAQGRAQGRAT